VGNSLEVSNFEIVILIAKQRKAKQSNVKESAVWNDGRANVSKKNC